MNMALHPPRSMPHAQAGPFGCGPVLLKLRADNACAADVSVQVYQWIVSTVKDSWFFSVTFCYAMSQLSQKVFDD
jgi:hypothetical protein